MATLSTWLDRHSLYLALLAAWIATLGSLYFSEVLHYLPCVLCWYQRILMYPLALLLTVGLVRKDEHLPVLVLPFSVGGLGLAAYHYLLEKSDLFDALAVCQASVPCTTPWINWFGFITIPFLSLIGFLTITLMMMIAIYAGEPVNDEETRSPWRIVLSVIAVVFAAFIILVYLNQQAAQF